MAAERLLRQLYGPIVVDASVAVEYLVRLSMTGPAQSLIRTVVDREGELWAPDLVYPECVSALRRLVRLKAIDGESASRAVDNLLRLPLMIAGTRELSRRAWELRATVTPYDACYAALAELLDAPFVTADRKLASTLSSRGAAVVFLGDVA